MSIIENGTLQPDGMTVRLDKKVGLPPGRVTVEVRTVATPSGPTMLEVLDRIHLDQQRRGRVPVSEQEMAGEIERMRSDDDEYEERWNSIWSLSERRAKEPGPP